MSFETFPSYLPFYESLHNQDALAKEVDALSSKTLANKAPNLRRAPKSHPFMLALKQVQQFSRVQNGNAQALTTTDNPCLDLFSSLPSFDDLHNKLEQAFEHDAMLTVAIIIHCRSIHDGKKEKNVFYKCFYWLLNNHPKTALENLQFVVKGAIPSRPVTDQDHLKSDDPATDSQQQAAATGEPMDTDVDKVDHMDTDDRHPQSIEKPVNPKPLFYKSHGCWKDLLNLVSIYVLGDTEDPANSTALSHPRQPVVSHVRSARQSRVALYREAAKERKEMHPKKAEKLLARHLREEDHKNQFAKEAAARTRQDVRHDRQQQVTHLLKHDPLYRALHFTVARLFATQLEQDLDVLRSFVVTEASTKYALGDRLSLAAKWAPSLASAHDKFSLMATSIAELLFLKDPVLAQDRRAYRLNGARDLYRRQVLGPLRRAMDLTETRMSKNEWKKIDFSHVSAKCMQDNRDLFARHAKVQFARYMRAVEKGERSVAGASLGPHELVQRALQVDDKTPREQLQLLNGQWASYLRDLTEATGGQTLQGSLAICDISNSMNYGSVPGVRPLDAAIGLSLTVLALSSPPFADMMMTFGDEPALLEINTSASIVEQAHQISKAPSGYSINFHKVFLDILLPMAIRFKIKQEDMVKRLFVFTCMQFNDMPTEETSSTEENDEGNKPSKFETLWESIVIKYHEAGYEPPEIVWWNLCDRQIPLAAQGSHDTPGMAMVAGYSQSMLKTFMQGDAIRSRQAKERPVITPLQLMQDDLAKPSFSGLQILD
ncbi:hypothetical protein DM01DRAFT_1335436 [Hesseltinella vesiculosa]|uniref:Uncharacterized protein n=1 Tax=Hesseltinella vesiculosa TaxID=101127 RepID=A0A1X2GJC2_9FUNG|nr:hypothetical protein DM01DRAFT_1335436 [Hesseltinella vesiculosa]